MTPKDFVAEIGAAAQKSMASTGIPASFVVAEGALESGWGASQLATKAYNLFGVKADSAWHGPTLEIITREFIGGKWIMEPARWRSYGDWLGSITDHASFLQSNPRYRPAFAYKDGIQFAKAVALAGYATDPDYAQKIASLITEHQLQSLDSAPPAAIV